MPVEIIYQTIEGLHKACPNHTGDWYFTGDYPTLAGTELPIDPSSISWKRMTPERIKATHQASPED